jgi:hypothetical protein
MREFRELTDRRKTLCSALEWLHEGSPSPGDRCGSSPTRVGALLALRANGRFVHTYMALENRYADHWHDF